jgi:hypothetical protein
MNQTQLREPPKTFIRIGHPVYSGVNKCYYAFSKSEAVRELQWRGYKRDVAREIVKRICSTPEGSATLSCPEGVTEIHNQLQLMLDFDKRIIYATRKERMEMNGGRLA